MKKRRLQDGEETLSEITRVQHFRVSDSFTVPKKQFLDYCLTNPNSETVGFQMDMEMDRLELPNRHNANAKRIEMKYTLQQYFFADVIFFLFFVNANVSESFFFSAKFFPYKC